MTIPAGESALNAYTGNGAADTYDYEFKISDEADLLVKQTTDEGVETTLVLTTDYTVTGVGDDEGGDITLVAGNLATNYQLTIEDNVALSQATPFGNQSAFYAALHETAFDKITRLVRRAFSDIALAMTVPKAYSDGVSVILPQPIADMIIRWNSAADALENVSAETINGEAAIASYTTETFLDGVDFNDGVTTALNLASAPGSKSNTQIYFDGVYVSKEDYEVAAAVITFDSPITAGTAVVEVVYGQSAGDVGPDHSSISMIAGTGLSGGGTIAANRTFNLSVNSLTVIEGQDIAATDSYLLYDVSAGTHKRVRHQDAGNPVVDDTSTSRVLASTDAQKYIRMNNASAIAVTLNAGVGKKGNEIAIEQTGAGQVTVGGTATINGRNGLKTAGQHAVIFLKCVDDSDTWTLGGDSST